MFFNPVPKNHPAGLVAHADDGVLFFLVLLQQFGRCAIGLAAAENLAAMQTMLQIALGLFLVNLGLAHHRSSINDDTEFTCF